MENNDPMNDGWNVDPEDHDQLLEDADGNSFEDSERFEDDSICSWHSQESLVGAQNWRGWQDDASDDDAGHFLREPQQQPAAAAVLEPQAGPDPATVASTSQLANVVASPVLTLQTLCAQHCAEQHSYVSLQDQYQNLVETNIHNPNTIYKPGTLPESILVDITRRCFPKSEENMRMYSCLATRNGNEFLYGEMLLEREFVSDVVQIGFLLTGTVNGSVCVDTEQGTQFPPGIFQVSAKIDRCRIVELECRCATQTQWCQHTVALCLYRMRRAGLVAYRPPLSDTIISASQEKLQIFVCNLLDMMPRQFLPSAQQLLDVLGKLKEKEEIQQYGYTDPTISNLKGRAIWAVNEEGLQENIRKSINKFCMPAPQVHCDVQMLSNQQPAIASDWTALLRPLRSREPEALWNLLSITREMFRRRDENASNLLHMITEQCLSHPQVLTWWYITKLSQTGKWAWLGAKGTAILPNQHPALNCSEICDEIVRLWRCAALNPAITSRERQALITYLQGAHRMACENVWKAIKTSADSLPHVGFNGMMDERGMRLSDSTVRFTKTLFPGFYGALEGCQLIWTDAQLDGVDVAHPQMIDRSPSLPAEGAELDPVDFPNLPFLQKRTVPRPVTPLCTVSAYGGGIYPFEYYAQKEKKKKKKKRQLGGGMARRNHRRVQPRAYMPEFFDGPSLRLAARQGARSSRASRLHRANDPQEEESTESGQESDLPPNIALVASDDQQPGPSQAGGAGGPQFPQGDVEMLLASAHEQIDGLELKFARCEALYGHGYERQAMAKALELVACLSSSPPDLSAAAALLNFVGRGGEARGKRVPTEAGWDGKKRKVTASTAPLVIHVNIAPLSRDAKLVEVSEHTIRTFERALFLAKILNNDPANKMTLFHFLLFILELPQCPMANRHLQVKFYHLESELLLLLRSVQIGREELPIIRERATRLHAKASKPSLHPPSVALCHYIYDSLSYTFNLFPNGPHGPSFGTPQDTGREPSDDILAMKLALSALGSMQVYSEEDCPMLAESIRRQKGELTMALLARHRDSNEMIGHVLDKLLDPRIHLMYNPMRHQSNACYFLEQESSYVRHCAKGARPHYPLNHRLETPQDSSTPGTALVSRSASCQSAESSGSEAAEPVEEDEVELVARMMARCPQTSALQRQASSSDSNERNSPQPSVSSAGLSVGCNEVTDTDDSIGLELFKKRSRWASLCGGGGRPSEALVHFYMELAKKVLVEAGGSQRNDHFNLPPNQPNNPNHHANNRRLYIASFLIGLYALGLNNEFVNTNWQTRNYSTHVSWLTDHSMDIGVAALEILKDTWRRHLIPQEVAIIASQASNSRDAQTVSHGAELAMSALSDAFALPRDLCVKALLQCKEHSPQLLEMACRAVEQAAASASEGVPPEVLFTVSNHWYYLHQQAEPPRQGPSTSNQNQQHPPPRPPTTMPQFPMPPFNAPGFGGPLPLGYMPAHQLPAFFHPNLPPPLPPQQFLGAAHQHRPHTVYLQPQQLPQVYPPAGPSDNSRAPIHQSHSAPSLLPCQLAAPPHPPQPHDPPQQFALHPPPPPYPGDRTPERLEAAFTTGIKALEAMGKRRCQDDMRNPLKYAKNSMMGDEVMLLSGIARELDMKTRSPNASFSVAFYRLAARTVPSPYVLHKLALNSRELAQLFPLTQYPQGQGPPAHPRYNPPPTKLHYQMWSQIRVAFTGYFHPVTGELYAACLEAFYAALTFKVTHPRLGDPDRDEANRLVIETAETIKQIPPPNLQHQLREDFFRHIRAVTKNKELKTQLVSTLNTAITGTQPHRCEPTSNSH